jgi:hypothetical protein
MAQQVCVVLSTAERAQLTAIAADRNRPRKHIERAQMRPFHSVYKLKSRFAIAGIVLLGTAGPVHAFGSAYNSVPRAASRSTRCCRVGAPTTPP